MFDFGSMLGSGTNEDDHPWVGHEYIFESRPGFITLGSLGLWRRPFMSVEAPSHLPAAGNFTADRFVPEAWKPHYPNSAFTNMRDDDAFWAARIVSAFSDEAIQRIVEKAAYSDPAAVDHVTGTLIKRRDLVAKAWLTKANPIAEVRIDEQGLLRFRNAAAHAGLLQSGGRHQLYWFRFDNVTGRRHYVAQAETVDPVAPFPADALKGAEFSGVEIRTHHDEHPNWRWPVRLYFREGAPRRIAVGLERTGSQIEGPDRSPTCRSSAGAAASRPHSRRCVTPAAVAP
jgi:hypothetical protein